jgi:hypothetical protein
VFLCTITYLEHYFLILKYVKYKQINLNSRENFETGPGFEPRSPDPGLSLSLTFKL